MRRTWEWVFVGILLPYRCVGCDRRFLNFFSAEAARFPLESDSPLVATELVNSAPSVEIPSPAEVRPSPESAESPEIPDISSALAESIDRTLDKIRNGRGQVNGIRALTKPSQRRKDLRKKSDSQVIWLQVRAGDSDWLTADLLDTSQGGIGISASAPLTVSSTIAVRGKFEERQSEALSFLVVRWCAQTIHGNFQAGLAFGDHRSFVGNHSPSISAQSPEELDYYEILQLSPNAQAGTIERVYRILAQRYHPNTPQTANLEMFLNLYEAHRVLSDPELRAQYDLRRREAQRLHPTFPERTRILVKSESISHLSGLPNGKRNIGA